ncbi:methanobactin biosynthesis protein MbnC [Methylocystis sp. 9N]|uniref:Methanobactin biosynthesis protein MbnC n=1 Tax=Methylocystis borbori TaxID=3118750 RepID=A0ABU7XD18_9HYPH
MHLTSPSEPARIVDKELFDWLTDLRPQTQIPRQSRAFVRIDVCHRAYWHALFDICPQLLKIAAPDGLAILRPFMTWAETQNLTFDWSFYLWVYEWLKQSEFQDRIDNDLLITMMGASAARWGNYDRTPACGLVLASAEASEIVVAWKCRTASGRREIEIIDLEEPLPPPEESFGFFTLPSFELAPFPGWRNIPR